MKAYDMEQRDVIKMLLDTPEVTPEDLKKFIDEVAAAQKQQVEREEMERLDTILYDLGLIYHDLLEFMGFPMTEGIDTAIDEVIGIMKKYILTEKKELNKNQKKISNNGRDQLLKELSHFFY